MHPGDNVYFSSAYDLPIQYTLLSHLSDLCISKQLFYERTEQI